MTPSTPSIPSTVHALLRIVIVCLLLSSCGLHNPTPADPDVAETVYVGNASGYDNYLYAFDALTGAKKWETVIDYPGTSGPTLADGLVYMGGQANLFALDAATGTIKWKTQLGDPYKLDLIFGIPTVANGLVYVSVSGYVSKLYALDALTGTQKWEFTTGGFDILGPTVVNGIVYVGDTDKLYALNASSGAKIWEVTDLSGGGRTNPAVVDGVVYTNCGNYFYTHDAKTGAQKWMSNIGGAGSPTLANGLIYLKNTDLIAIDAATGKYVQEYDFIWEGSSNPVAANGIVYVGSGGAVGRGGGYTLHAVDAAMATKKWTQELEFFTSSSPTVAAGLVFIGTSGTDSKLYALDALTGAIRWGVSPSPYGNRFTPACVVTKQGKIYHASESGDQQ